jgi:hypothetical protein
LPPLSLRPCGTAASIAVRTPCRLSGRSLAVSEVSTAIMPQPMSTPTAAGMIAPSVAITLPTVAPMPQWTSGIAATWWNTIGSLATFSSWRRAAASSCTPCTQARIGTPSVSIRSYSTAAACHGRAAVGPRARTPGTGEATSPPKRRGPTTTCV